MIDLNVTVWIQLVNFLITLVVLNWLLVRPVRDILLRRKAAMKCLLDEIDTFAEKSRSLLTSYESALEETRTAAGLSRKQARTEAEAEEQHLILEASRQAQVSIKAGQAAVSAEAEAARKDLEGEMKVFTEAALTKVLG